MNGRRTLAIALFLLFVMTMVMGVGPGVLLVNQTGDVFGLPPLYAWGILWYFVQVGIAVVAYVFLWRTDSSSQSENEPPPQ